jgi:hypothetical protein
MSKFRWTAPRQMTATAPAANRACPPGKTLAEVNGHPTCKRRAANKGLQIRLANNGL